MENEFDFITRYDKLLDIKSALTYDRTIPPTKFNYVGFEIEISITFARERHTFIRTLLKKIKSAVGDDGFFVQDRTIVGDYSFEIVLDPMEVKKAVKIYNKILKIVAFSDGSLHFDKEHNCGLHVNFNQYDIEDIEESHKKLMLLINQKSQYFEENVYKQNYYEFNFDKYVKFQKTVSDKYLGVNYLNTKLVEVRNIKTGLPAKKLERIAIEIINVLFPDKLPKEKNTKHTRKIINITSEIFQQNNNKQIKESLDKDLLIIKFKGKNNEPKLIKITDKILKCIEESEKDER